MDVPTQMHPSVNHMKSHTLTCVLSATLEIETRFVMMITMVTPSGGKMCDAGKASKVLIWASIKISHPTPSMTPDSKPTHKARIEIIFFSLRYGGIVCGTCSR